MAAHEELVEFINKHETQLITSGIPKIYWTKLCEKLKEEVFDASNYISFIYDDDKTLHPVVSCEEGLIKNNPDSIFLIDHAWTYEAEYARKQLRSIPGLARRMVALMDLEESLKSSSAEHFYTNDDGEELPTEYVAELIFRHMWKYNQTYQVKILEQSESDVESSQASSLTEQVSLWYIMDELGSRIRHCDLPSMSLRSFYYVDREISYSILFPNQDLEYGAAVTRDYIAAWRHLDDRSTLLYPWQPEKFVFDEADKKDVDAILFSNESRLSECVLEEPSGVVYLPKKESYNVYTDVGVVAESLQAPKFSLVEDPAQADIVWIKDHHKDYKSLQQSGKQYINQFPSENVLTCKDLLARVVNRVGLLYPERCDSPGSTRPPWFQESYNLNVELSQFIHNFRKREERHEDNIWIVKPWNLGRSMDTHVTNNLNQIIRLRETGPKDGWLRPRSSSYPSDSSRSESKERHSTQIAFKYIHNPVLLERDGVGKVKFHFRYMAAVTSVDPLIVDIDSVLWIGCANKPFSLDNFDEYEKHFTTMNYRQEVTLKQIHHDELPEMFDRQNPGYKWQDVENEVHKIIKELFEAATSEPPPRGLGHCKMSRAYYALDFMLKWADDGSKKIQPVLLEVNFNPDCIRLVKYHPDSFHHLFSSLFLGEKTPWGSVRL